MDISVPSRFACLKIEDEEFRPVSNRSTKKKQEKQVKKTTAVNGNNKKVPVQQKQSTNVTTKKSKTKGKKEDKQWQEWKKKDDEFVNDNFEQDLQCAILQSKLDFENQKKNSVSVVVTTHDNKTKKKKTKTMSLDQFLEDGNQASVKDEPDKDQEEEEGNFFENVMVSAKQELKKEKMEEKRRERATNIEEVISLAQAQEKLEIEKAKNEQLRQELEEARKEISLVKKRNTTLCSMLSQGEMKDKVEVLVELERLTTVKEELTEEVARLHKLLEQERSSTKANSANVNGVPESHNAKHKDKHKKKKN